VFRCRDCGQAANPAEVEVDSICARCRSALHACVNCRWFDPSARWECRAEIEAPVRSKTKPNQCALFAAKVVLEMGAPEREDDPRAAFEALFR
jgi:hypothetical protein